MNICLHKTDSTSFCGLPTDSLTCRCRNHLRRLIFPPAPFETYVSVEGKKTFVRFRSFKESAMRLGFQRVCEYVNTKSMTREEWRIITMYWSLCLRFIRNRSNDSYRWIEHLYRESRLGGKEYHRYRTCQNGQRHLKRNMMRLHHASLKLRD